jgi:hypothetical protein
MEKFGSRINIPDSQHFEIEGNSAKLLMILLFYRMFTLWNELSEGDISGKTGWHVAGGCFLSLSLLPPHN